MNAMSEAKSKWGMAEGWVRKTIVTLVSLLVIGASSYIVNKAINSPSASEVNQMIDLKIGASPILTKGAEGAINQLVLDNAVEHIALKKDLEIIQGNVIGIKDDVTEIKSLLRK